MDSTELSLDYSAQNQASFGPCACCGKMTSRVWGYVYQGGEAIAAYFVEWTPGHEHSAANFDLILGKWGHNASALDRWAASLEYRVIESGPAFSIIDAASRSIASSSLLSHALLRSELVGTPLAATVFDVCDVIYAKDARLAHLRA